MLFKLFLYVDKVNFNVESIIKVSALYN